MLIVAGIGTLETVGVGLTRDCIALSKGVGMSLNGIGF